MADDDKFSNNTQLAGIRIKTIDLSGLHCCVLDKAMVSMDHHSCMNWRPFYLYAS